MPNEPAGAVARHSSQRAGARYQYRFVILGRYEARLKGNESAVTVNVAVGPESHVAHAGTLTMSEAEWDRLASALRDALGEDVEIIDHSDRPSPLP